MLFGKPPDEFVAPNGVTIPEMAKEHTTSPLRHSSTSASAPDELEIGPARDEELGQVLELWGSARSRYSSTPDNLEVLRRLRTRDADAILVARRSGDVVGTVIAAWDGWRGNMYRLAVAVDQRRSGTGLALVREGERRLYEAGARRVTALVGGEDDEAIGLWRAAGFEHDPLVSRFVKNL
jgi:ribosomal protein S18 acetylase RimI-like enzyme